MDGGRNSNREVVRKISKRDRGVYSTKHDSSIESIIIITRELLEDYSQARNRELDLGVLSSDHRKLRPPSPLVGYKQLLPSNSYYYKMNRRSEEVI